MQSMTGIERLTKQEVIELTKQTKETVATNLFQYEKIFTLADMWNIRRQGRRFSTRRNNAQL